MRKLVEVEVRLVEKRSAVVVAVVLEEAGLIPACQIIVVEERSAVEVVVAVEVDGLSADDEVPATAILLGTRISFSKSFRSRTILLFQHSPSDSSFNAID